MQISTDRPSALHMLHNFVGLPFIVVNFYAVIWYFHRYRSFRPQVSHLQILQPITMDYVRCTCVIDSVGLTFRRFKLSAIMWYRYRSSRRPPLLGLQERLTAHFLQYNYHFKCISIPMADICRLKSSQAPCFPAIIYSMHRRIFLLLQAILPPKFPRQVFSDEIISSIVDLVLQRQCSFGWCNFFGVCSFSCSVVKQTMEGPIQKHPKLQG